MKDKLSFGSLYGGALGVFAFVMLVFPKPIAICFALLAVVILTGLVQRKMVFRTNAYGLLLMAFYLMYILYIVFTRSPEWAGRYAENKLSFFLLPLLLFCRPKEGFSLYLPSVGFIAGALVLFITGIIHSTNCYSISQQISCLFASKFSEIHHPTYTSMYYTTAIGLLITGRRHRWKGFNRLSCSLGIMMMLIGVFLSLSLAGLLFIILAAAVYILYLIYKRFGRVTALVCLVISPFVMYAFIRFTPNIEGEYESAKYYAQQYASDPDEFVKTHVYPNTSGSEIRLIMWTTSWQSFMQYPMGVGTGNVDGVLAYRLHKLGQHELAKVITDYNPHNQYLQTGLEIGVFGLLILVLLVVAGSVVAAVRKQWLLVLVLSGMAFNMLFESILQRQSGIVYFAFMVALLTAWYGARKGKNHSTVHPPGRIDTSSSSTREAL